MVMVPSLDSAFPPDRVEGILQLCTVWEGLLFVGWVDDDEDFFALASRTYASGYWFFSA